MSTVCDTPDQAVPAKPASRQKPSPPVRARRFQLSPNVLGAALSAALLTLATPPWDLGFLGWVALVPLFWAMLGEGVGRWALGVGEAGRSGVQSSAPPRLPEDRGELAGSPAASNAPGSVTQSSPRYRGAGGANAQRPTPNAFLTGFTHGTLLLLFLVPWFAAFTPAGYITAALCWGVLSGVLVLGLVALLRRTPVWAAPPLLAAGWTLQEWIHAQGTLAFPWGTLAATQYRYLPVIQVLDLCGAYGLSFLMALFAASLALFVRAWGVPHRRVATRWLLGTTTGIILCLARGEWILSHPAPVTESARVAVIQESESREAPGVAVHSVSPWSDYAEATRSAQRAGAELVAWPESACQNDAVHDGLTQALLTSLLSEGRAHLLTGSFVEDPAGAGISNSAVMLAPDAHVLGSYDKVRIVPFGEYLPARALLGWTVAMGMPSDDLRPGTEWKPLPWARGSVGTSICFESAFGEISRTYVNRGANLLAVLTSDGWSGRSAAGLQHAAFAPLRAVETRRSVARAAATGISELIDPYGRPLEQLPMFQRGYRMADLPLRTDRTLYALLGDWPVVLAWMILLAALWAAFGPSGVSRLRR